MSKHSKLMNFLSGMPDFVFDYIEIAYNGESINTQIGYSIDIKTFLEYLQKFNFSYIEKIEDFTVADMEKVTLRDLNAFTEYLKEYEKSEIQAFCTGIKKDILPVKNAISFSISSGFVEGNNNKFKVLKRIVYGRSGLVNLEKKCKLAFLPKNQDFSLSALL